MKHRLPVLFIFIFAAGLFSAFTVGDFFPERGKKKLKALIMDGQNNHGAWPKTTMIMKDYLEQVGFAVDIERTKLTWQGPHNDNDEGMGEARRKQLQTEYPISGKQTLEMEKAMPDSTYFPAFEKYDLVVSNFGWLAAPLPAKTMAAFAALANLKKARSRKLS